MRYYWLKLKGEFFRDLRVKKLRQCENGAALTLLYLEVLVTALPTDGVLPLLGIEAPAAELSLLLDAPEADCAALLSFLSAHGLLKETPEGLYLPMLESYTGSECESAKRMRRKRETDKEPAACWAKPAETDREEEAASFFSPSQCAHNVQKCDAEIEKEIEKETESDPEKDTEAEKKAPAALPEGEGRRDPERDETAPPLPLQSGEEFYLTKKQTAEFAALYPAVNVPEQLRAMRGWLISNPDQGKPREGILRFVNGWLNKEQTMIQNGARRGKAGARESFEKTQGGYGGSGYSAPPSYNIEAAMRETMTTVPKLKKRRRI